MQHSQHHNAAIARRLWEATAAGDPNTLLELYAPDVVWRTHGNNPTATMLEGSQALIEYMAGYGDLAEKLELQLIDVFASDDGAVIRYRTLAERGPKQLDTEILLTLRIERGRIVRGEVVPMDAARNDAFWRLE